VCWFVPCVIIVILAYLVWTSSHSLDPYKPITKASNKSGVYSLHEGENAPHMKPIVIEVVALDWKWLFIYPEYNIATINYIQFPVNTPLAFKVTADAPMNSFVIPALGGQIYAMEGMQTKIHYLATEQGVFRGRSTNYSGKGFAGMKFLARSSSEQDFKNWIKKIQKEGRFLSSDEYIILTKKSANNQVQYFSSVEPELFNSIMMKFMKPSEHNQHQAHNIHVGMSH
jgi:cytochrome o ubiquinol oxidase subunit 2